MVNNKLSDSALQKKLRSKGVKPKTKKKLAQTLASRRWDNTKGDLIEKMSLGGMSGGDLMSSGASLANLGGDAVSSIGNLDTENKSFWGGLGGVMKGAATGGALGGVAALFGTIGADKAAKEQQKKIAAAKADAIQQVQMNSNANAMNQYAPTFATGGQVQQPNVEVEGGEVIDEYGDMELVEGRSHVQGGVKKNLKPGTRVFSKKLGYANQADELRKQIERYEQILYS